MRGAAGAPVTSDQWEKRRRLVETRRERYAYRNGDSAAVPWRFRGEEGDWFYSCVLTGASADNSLPVLLVTGRCGRAKSVLTTSSRILHGTANRELNTADL